MRKTRLWEDVKMSTENAIIQAINEVKEKCKDE